MSFSKQTNSLGSSIKAQLPTRFLPSSSSKLSHQGSNTQQLHLETSREPSTSSTTDMPPVLRSSKRSAPATVDEPRKKQANTSAVSQSAAASASSSTTKATKGSKATKATKPAPVNATAASKRVTKAADAKATAAAAKAAATTAKAAATKAIAAAKSAATKAAAAQAKADKGVAARPKAMARKPRASRKKAPVLEAPALPVIPPYDPAHPYANPHSIPREVGPVINTAPTQRLHVFVTGEGSNGELGLGTKSNVIDVKRPRLNHLLDADKVGVVQMALGGMHVVALTHDNKIITWGVNDDGALGRDITHTPRLVSIDQADTDASNAATNNVSGANSTTENENEGSAVQADDAAGAGSESDSDDDSGLNPKEANPAEVPSAWFPEGTKFTQVAACDSATFLLTDDGAVYGWGCFRGDDGVIGFTKEVSTVQKFPILITGLPPISSLTTGTNHVYATTPAGRVWSWGAGQQYQLGRRVVQRFRSHGLGPREFGLRNIKYMGSGDYHGFAINEKGDVFTWGLNSFGQTGILYNAGCDGAVINMVTKLKSLADYKIKAISGGAHHTLAQTEDDDLLVWGRIDGHQTGIEPSDLPLENVIVDQKKEPRIISVPTIIPDIKAVQFSCKGDTCMAITPEGKAYAWGFSGTYQAGCGEGEYVHLPTHIVSKTMRDKRMVWTGVGGQFSVLASLADDSGKAPSCH
ncbi:MAG: hypothetical protein M1829_001508 [Trizodia sp. TS-e1964]|nr:MAG: hypothetical protein M1829_001508 [Trizodia sp. TS-e1964]